MERVKPIWGGDEDLSSKILDWQQSVIDKDLTSPPLSPSLGDRYIIAAPAS